MGNGKRISIFPQKCKMEGSKYKAKIESSNPDVYLITPKNSKEIVDSAFDLYKEISGPGYYSESDKNILENGEEMRPQEAFAVKITENKDGKRIMADNRNARGYVPNQEHLKKSIENVFVEEE
jgi:hypothetical protein